MATDDIAHTSPSDAAERRDPQWGGHLLDPGAYLRRIGYEGPGGASLDSLTALHRAHKAAIAFENIDVALERGISLELDHIQAKLVQAGRGGYCFEHNMLFAAALEHFGFTVTRQLARVRLGRPTIRYRAHTALVVESGGELLLADVGFGSEGLIDPIPLVDGAIAKDGGFSWRVAREGDQWVLQSLHDDDWFDLYSFRMEQHFAVDFDVSNHYTAHHPRSTFTGKLVAMRGDGSVQQTLTDTELVTRHAGGGTELSSLTGDEVIETLREIFAIRLSETDALLLRRHLTSTLSPRQEA
jgi:N-hydroxyarylamine O-acetyltransferase